MELERKCLQCRFCAEDTTPSPQVALIGQRRYMCLHGPISVSMLPTGNGGLASIASYPSINAQTISCGQFTDKDSDHGHES